VTQLLAYCILPAQPPATTAAAPAAGVGGAPVRTVTAGELACLVSAIDTPLHADAPALRAYNAVIAAAMDRHVTPVPLRFGQLFADDAAVATAITEAAGRWLELLRRFAGRAEYGVRVFRSAAAEADTARDVHAAAANVGSARAGTAYMAALAQRSAAEARRRAALERLAADILLRAGETVAEARAEPLDSEHGVATLAHLVAWEHAADYHAAMQRARDEMTGLRFLCTGPWPPYSFVA
jgi:hypothetical protein